MATKKATTHKPTYRQRALRAEKRCRQLYEQVTRLLKLTAYYEEEVIQKLEEERDEALRNENLGYERFRQQLKNAHTEAYAENEATKFELQRRINHLESQLRGALASLELIGEDRASLQNQLEFHLRHEHRRSGLKQESAYNYDSPNESPLPVTARAAGVKNDTASNTSGNNERKDNK